MWLFSQYFFYIFVVCKNALDLDPTKHLNMYVKLKKGLILISPRSPKRFHSFYWCGIKLELLWNQHVLTINWQLGVH